MCLEICGGKSPSRQAGKQAAIASKLTGGKQYKDHLKAGLEVFSTAKALMHRKQTKDICAEGAVCQHLPLTKCHFC